MGFSGTWLRSLSGAVGAAIVVPVGLVLSIALAATVGGGVGGVGGLRQLVGGPQLPASDPVARALATTGTRSAASVPAIPRTRSFVPVRRAAVEPGTGARRERRAVERRRNANPAPRRPTATTPADPAPGTPAPAPTPDAPEQLPPPASDPPPPRPDPLGDVVRGVGEVADDVVRPLPVVGPPVADAVGTVIDLVAPPRAPAGTIVPLEPK